MPKKNESYITYELFNEIYFCCSWCTILEVLNFQTTKVHQAKKGILVQEQVSVTRSAPTTFTRKVCLHLTLTEPVAIEGKDVSWTDT